MITSQVNQNQFDALVSFTYNLGVGALHGSTLLHLVNQSDFTNAANEFPKWDHAGGVVVAGLLRRRLAEQTLFTTPV
jgi:lysozyme